METSKAVPDVVGSAQGTMGAELGPKFSDSDVLLYMLSEVLGIPPESETLDALKESGIRTVFDIFLIPPGDFELIRYTNREGIQQPLVFLDRMKLMKFGDFGHFLMRANGNLPLTTEQWMLVDEKDWRTYTLYRSTTSTQNVEAVEPVSSSKRSATDAWSYGIKRYISDYTTFKEAKFWHSWKLDVETTAKLHGCEDVLDGAYTATTPEETQLLALKMTFMYSVFLKHVEHPDARNIVRSSKNAQEVYQLLVRRFESSPEAGLDAQQLRQKISEMKLDSSWKSTPTKFLQLWEKDVTTLDAIVPENLRDWPESARMNQLISAVNFNPELGKVIADDRTLVQKGMTPMTYTQYLQLLKSRAYEIDRRTATTRNVNAAGTTGKGRKQRQANQAQQGGTPNTNKPPIAWLPDDKWKAMSQEEKTAYLKKKRAQKRTVNSGDQTQSPPAAPGPPATPQVPVAPPATNVSNSFTVPHQTPVTVAAAGVMQAATQSSTVPPAVTPDLRNVMSALGSRGAAVGTTGTFTIGPNGTTFNINIARTYKASFGDLESHEGALVDGGANGGMAGPDLRVLETHDTNTVQVVGIAGNTLEDLPVVTAAGFINTTHGPIIGIFHQYAHHPDGKTIHSVPQLEAFDNMVDCRSRKKGGKQRIVTPDGWIIPLNIRRGLAYIDMRPPTDGELNSLPHVAFTSDVDWDPSTLDDETNLDVFNDNLAYDVDTDTTLVDLYTRSSRLSSTGEEGQRVVAAMILEKVDGEVSALDLEDTVDLLTTEAVFEENRAQVQRREPDYEKVRACLGYAPIEVIKLTFKNTTQFARNTVRLPFRNHVKSRFPALNVRRRNEPVATDTVWADVPAIGSGAVGAQVFVGRHTYVTDVYGCKTDGEFAGILEDNIRLRGAMDCLISDSAKALVSNKVIDILRMYKCRSFQSEAENQQQNFAENRIGTLKDWTNTVMDRGGAPGYTWLLAIQYVPELLNHLANKNLDGQTPLAKLYGVTPDISAFLAFYFYQPVLYAVDNGWPSETQEASGRWVGVANNVGDALTYKILTDDTNQIIFRSAVRARDGYAENLRVTTTSPEEPKGIGRVVVKSREYALPDVHAITFTPDELVGRSYLGEAGEDGTRFRMRIIKKIDEMEGDIDSLKFLVKRSDGEIEDLIAYNDLIDIVSEQYAEERDNPDKLWTFKSIGGHEGPLSVRDPNYKGSKYNVLVNWEDGTSTYEPLDIIGKDDPVTCAQYAKNNGLLNEPGWKRFKRLVKNSKVFSRMVNQARLKSIRRAPIYKYGVEVPRSFQHAMALDKENGNTKWADAVGTEITQIVVEYSTFKSLGLGAKIPEGYKLIRGHFVFDVKHDGRYKARYVAGGHLTDPPLESVYSGVVTLRSLRLVIFLAELNSLQLYAADVGNAYLEAFTKEKICIIGGSEFRQFGLEGHTLIIVRALYGLKTSGARWHERFADTLRAEGFTPCKADNDVWLRRKGNIYEYIAVYVDDLAMAMEDPAAFCELLKTKYNYKLKGDAPLKYHLGCDFGRDPDGTYSYGPIKYVEKMMESYERMFKVKPKAVRTPLEKGDHPELDTTPECTMEGRALYMSMIGQCQWLISLGRFDIACAIMTLSRFRAAPKEGHLARLKRVYGYLSEFSTGNIRVRTGIPDFKNLDKPKADWTSIYGNVTEEVPKDMPEPLGKPVLTTTYVDANLYHDYISGRSVTGVLQLVNQTPVDWYCKRQATVETATYGSEFNAARTATEQVMDLRYTLRMLGVPLMESYMFGDNQSVVTNSTVPHSQLNKRHNALAYHRVREAIASGILTFFHIDGKKNPADILSKHCGFNEAWPHIKTLLFWRGDTKDIVFKDEYKGPDKGE